jgi:hypothetical protein
MNLDGAKVEEISKLSSSIFWMVLPSVFFFLAFPQLVRFGLKFYPALALSSAMMAGVYWIYVEALGRFGIKL